MDKHRPYYLDYPTIKYSSRQSAQQSAHWDSSGNVCCYCLESRSLSIHIIERRYKLNLTPRSWLSTCNVSQQNSCALAHQSQLRCSARILMFPTSKTMTEATEPHALKGHSRKLIGKRRVLANHTADVGALASL